MIQHEKLPDCISISAVFYPTDPGSYAPVVFVPGFDGVVYAEWYSVAMNNLAGYGYVIAGVDLFWPVMDKASKLYGINDPPETVFEVIQWVRDSTLS